MGDEADTWETTVAVADEAYYQQIYQYEGENKSQDDMTSFLRKAQGVSTQQLNQIIGAAFQANASNVADNKKSFYTALKLIACAQHGINPSSPILSTGTPLPQFKDYEIITTKDRQKYLRIFHASSPVGGLINGDKAMKILMRSKLPVSLLSHVWNLADIDRQGKLDSTGFVIAMHYVAKCMGGNTSLPHANAPDSILKSARGESPSLATMTTPPPRTTEKLGSTSRPPPPPPPPPPAGRHSRSNSVGQYTDLFAPLTPGHPWNVDKNEIDAYMDVFNSIDTGHKGYIEGSEAVGFFGHSNLSPSDLASVWDLADTQNRGQLTKNEFAIAMHLIKRVRGGSPLPSALPPSMLSHFESKSQESLTKQVQHLQETIAKEQEDIPELQQNTKEQETVVSDLQKQVDALEQSLQQVVKQKSELQSTLDTLKATEQEKRHKIALLEKEYNTTQTELASLKAAHQHQLALAGVSTSQLVAAQNLKEKSAQELALAQAGQFDKLSDAPLRSPPPPPPSSRHHRTQSFQAQQSPGSTGSPNKRPPAPPPSKKKRAGTPSTPPIDNDNQISFNEPLKKEPVDNSSMEAAVTASVTSAVASAALSDVITNTSPPPTTATEEKDNDEQVSSDEEKQSPEFNTNLSDSNEAKKDTMALDSHDAAATSDEVDGSNKDLDKDNHKTTMVRDESTLNKDVTAPTTTDNEDTKGTTLGIADVTTNSEPHGNDRGVDKDEVGGPSTIGSDVMDIAKEKATGDSSDSSSDMESSVEEEEKEETATKSATGDDTTALDDEMNTSANAPSVSENALKQTATDITPPNTAEATATHTLSSNTFNDAAHTTTGIDKGDNTHGTVPELNEEDATTATDDINIGGNDDRQGGESTISKNDDDIRGSDGQHKTGPTEQLETTSGGERVGDNLSRGLDETAAGNTHPEESMASGEPVSESGNNDKEKQQALTENSDEFNNNTGSPEIHTATTTATGSMKGDDHDFEVVDNASAASSFMSASMGGDDDAMDEFEAAFSEALPDAKMVSSSTKSNTAAPSNTTATNTTPSGYDGHFYDDVDDFDDAFDPKVFSAPKETVTSPTVNQQDMHEQQTKSGDSKFDPFAAGQHTNDAFGDTFAPTEKNTSSTMDFADAFGDNFTATTTTPATTNAANAEPSVDHAQNKSTTGSASNTDDYADFRDLVVSPEQVADFESNPFDEPFFEHKPDMTTEHQELAQPQNELPPTEQSKQHKEETAQPAQESFKQPAPQIQTPPQKQNEAGLTTSIPRVTGIDTQTASLAPPPPPSVSPSVSTSSYSDRRPAAEAKTNKTEVEEGNTTKGKHKGLFSLSSMLPKQKGKKSKSKKKDKSTNDQPPQQQQSSTEHQPYQDPSLETTLPAMSDQEVMANLREFGVDNESMKTLTNMGFTVDQAKEALERYDYDVQKATNFLLDQ
ncbi:hypothetical protein BC941DRAFT_466035 [Chlamydoabsidia padenii]|nr:hypothetical protein BC941DRAFT_466035 [Chlamydoabsidia padenii]